MDLLMGLYSRPLPFYFFYFFPSKPMMVDDIPSDAEAEYQEEPELKVSDEEEEKVVEEEGEVVSHRCMTKGKLYSFYLALQLII